MKNQPTSEIISQPANNTAPGNDNELVLLSDTGHNSVYRYVKDGRVFALKAVKPDDKDAERHTKALPPKLFDRHVEEMGIRYHPHWH